MEMKQLETEIAIKSLQCDGTFTGYASVFHTVDRHRDRVMPGAFVRTLREQEGQIKLLWQHRQDEPIGTITLLQEDEYGLYIEGTLALSVERAKEAHALLKSSAVGGLSIGYTAKGYDVGDDGVRMLYDVDLWEISIVTFPANEEAVITSVKGVDDTKEENAVAQQAVPNTVRTFETFLRQSGFSRSQAKAIASNGFRVLEDQQEAEGDLPKYRAKRLESAMDKAMQSISPGV